MSTQTISMASGDSIQVEHVAGDLQVQGWERADLEARGDLVQIEKQSGSVVVSCSGDLALSIPRGSHLLVQAIAGDAHLQNLEGQVELTLVAGDAILQNLAGSVLLNGTVGGDTRMENVANVSMGGNKPDHDLHVAERIRHKVEQAARRAESKVRRAEHRAFAHAEMRIHQSDPARWKYNAAQGLSSAGEPADSVSDEERLSILRMLHDKKITSEQAERLLAALEGSA